MKTRSKSKAEPKPSASINQDVRKTRSVKSKAEVASKSKPSAKENKSVPKPIIKPVQPKKEQKIDHTKKDQKCEQSKKERILQPKEEQQISQSKKPEPKRTDRKQENEVKMIGNYRLRGARKQVNYKEDKEENSDSEEAPVHVGLPKKLTGKKVINLGKSKGSLIFLILIFYYYK